MLLDDPNGTGMVWSSDVINNLVYAPSVMDAAPVRHGRWIDERCSICGKYVYVGDTDDYCPHCGAKMDGENE